LEPGKRLTLNCLGMNANQVGSHDTTATSVAWSLYLLSKYPAIQEKLRAEIREHSLFRFDPSARENQQRLENADADQLPYLDNFCRESLRYIPSIPTTVRQSIVDDKLGEYMVPAGTTIYILANAINRLPQYWGTHGRRIQP